MRVHSLNCTSYQYQQSSILSRKFSFAANSLEYSAFDIKRDLEFFRPFLLTEMLVSTLSTYVKRAWKTFLSSPLFFLKLSEVVHWSKPIGVSQLHCKMCHIFVWQSEGRGQHLFTLSLLHTCQKVGIKIFHCTPKNLRTVKLFGRLIWGQVSNNMVYIYYFDLRPTGSRGAGPKETKVHQTTRLLRLFRFSKPIDAVRQLKRPSREKVRQ